MTCRACSRGSGEHPFSITATFMGSIRGTLLALRQCTLGAKAAVSARSAFTVFITLHNTVAAHHGERTLTRLAFASEFSQVAIGAISHICFRFVFPGVVACLRRSTLQDAWASNVASTARSVRSLAVAKSVKALARAFTKSSVTVARQPRPDDTRLGSSCKHAVRRTTL